MNPLHSDARALFGTERPLATRFAAVRDATLALTEPLSAEDCQVQSMPDASPTKWHLAHVSWFFETFVLERFERAFKPFDASFRVLFNSYYQGVGEQHPRAQRALITRPLLADVLHYRAQVDERVQALLAAHADEPALNEVVTLGLHHEQQHQELLLTDIKHALSFDDRHPPYARRWPLTTVAHHPLQWFGFDGGLIEHGFDAQRDGPFCFDNETPRHRAFTAPFQLASRPATCGDYLAFIEGGGYQRPELWLSQGWDWVRAGQRAAPLYWRRADGGWTMHTLQGRVEIDPRTPVCHLSYFEADAFASWADARLPSEVEWEHAARRLRGAAPPHFVERGAFHPPPQRRCRPSRRSCSATCGSGRSRATAPTPATARCLARSANTTASSCATSTSCAAARAPRRRATCGPATATSSRRMRSGSSVAFDSRGTLERRLQLPFQEVSTFSTSERNSRW